MRALGNTARSRESPRIETIIRDILLAIRKIRAHDAKEVIWNFKLMVQFFHQQTMIYSIKRLTEIKINDMHYLLIFKIL